MFVHLTLVPVVYMGEPKTKPTQHSVRELREIGIQPDVLLLRSPQPPDEELRSKISLFTNVDEGGGDLGPRRATTIYEIPLVFAEQKLDEIIVRRLGLAGKGPWRDGWKEVVDQFRGAKRSVRVAIVGKYTDLHDSYISIFEALHHGGIANDVRVELVKFEGEDLEDGRDLAQALGGCDGVLVPGGFGDAGHRGHDPGRALGAGEEGPLLRHLPRAADHGDRVRAQRPRPGGRQLHRVRPGHDAPRGEPARGAGRRQDLRRHHAPGPERFPPRGGHEDRRRLRRPRSSPSATGTATRSPTATARASRRPASS